MLGQLAGATFVTPDLDASLAAYAAFLGYRADEIVALPPALADRWGAPEAAGARVATLWPDGGEPTFIRLVESAIPDGYTPLSSFGWNALEIVVRDLDALAQRLADSPFQIIGPPETLDFDFTDKIRAMQVVGPGKEILYLTEIDGPIPGFALPEPVGDVGQMFVAILGGASIEDMAATLARDFGVETGPTVEAKIAILSHAHGLPESTRHRLATVALEQRTLIELDAFPAGTVQRPLSDCGLPIGFAIATFAGKVDRPGVTRGPAGALVERIDISDFNKKKL